jgi:hypothetical protein
MGRRSRWLSGKYEVVKKKCENCVVILALSWLDVALDAPPYHRHVYVRYGVATLKACDL